MNHYNIQHLNNEETKKEFIRTLETLPTAVAKVELCYQNGLRWPELYDSTRIGKPVLAPVR